MAWFGGARLLTSRSRFALAAREDGSPHRNAQTMSSSDEAGAKHLCAGQKSSLSANRTECVLAPLKLTSKLPGALSFGPLKVGFPVAKYL
jgi:hypothetical protein